MPKLGGMVARPSPAPGRRSRSLALAALVALASASLWVGPGHAAQDPPERERCERWPAFSRVEPTAGEVVLVRVTEAEDGVATKADTVDVIRGSAPVDWSLWELDAGTPRGVPCDSMPPKPPIRAEVGDQLVLAIDGALPERTGRVDTLALVMVEPGRASRSELERLTLLETGAIDDERPPGALPMDPPAEPRTPTEGLGETVLDALGAVIGPIRQAFLVPWPERTPAPMPAGAEPLDLQVQEPAPPHPVGEGAACMQARWAGSLEVTDGALVPADGDPVLWPRGFSARIVDGVGELVAPDGSIVSRAGEEFEAGGGSIGDHGFIVCTVEGVYYSPAS